MGNPFSKQTRVPDPNEVVPSIEPPEDTVENAQNAPGPASPASGYNASSLAPSSSRRSRSRSTSFHPSEPSGGRPSVSASPGSPRRSDGPSPSSGGRGSASGSAGRSRGSRSTTPAQSPPENDDDGTEQSPAGEDNGAPAASSPVPDDLDSPDLLPPQQIAQALAGAVGTYVRPRQPNAPLPTPGHLEFDDQDPEQQAWTAVFRDSEGPDDVLAAVQDYLNVASVNDFLARITQIHGENERVTRERFARRYMDDLPWRDAQDLDILVNQARMLWRMLMDEVDLHYRDDEEVQRRWRDLVRQVMAQGTGPMRRPLLRTDVLRDLEAFIALYGWDEVIRCFRLTHGTNPNYRAAIGRFFYRDAVTNVEETLMPARRRVKVSQLITEEGRRITVEVRRGRGRPVPADADEELRDVVRRLVSWLQYHGHPMVAGDVRARVRDSDGEMVRRRLENVRANEFDDVGEEDSRRRIDDALHPRYDADFRWGRLYILVLRHIELFGAEAALRAVAQHIPAHIRPLLSQEGADAVLRQGYMRTGDATLAALIADWLADTRRNNLPPVLREAPRVRRRAPAPTPAEDTMTRRSRDRMQRRHNAEMDDVNVRLIERDVALEERGEELNEAREELEEAREEAEVLRIRLEAFRDDYRDDAQRRQQRPTRRPQPPPPGDDAESEDELARPSPPLRPHGYGARPDDFDEYYDVTPRRSPDAQRRRKRRRSESSNGEVPEEAPPGRRRREVDHVSIPVAVAPAPAAPAVPPPAAPAVPSLAATGGRVSRSMKRAGKGTLNRGLK